MRENPKEIGSSCRKTGWDGGEQRSVHECFLEKNELFSKQCMLLREIWKTEAKKYIYIFCHVAVPNSIAGSFQIKEVSYLTGFPKASC